MSANTSDFSTFLLSLASSVMVHLGRVPDPTGGTGEVNLQLARHSIDLIAMLEAKTKGNLTPEEATLLARVLHDTRMAWLEEKQRGAS
ncbi:MAG: DUF1844 domain-containing protein [Deltaproteobacteria bacterium]|nr:DUF1844 domain-containing protein [Deltaproteobacteria bacterium]